MPMKPEEMVKIFQKQGFIKVSQKDSHLKLKNPITNRQTTVPIHKGKELDKSTQEKIFKQAGIR